MSPEEQSVLSALVAAKENGGFIGFWAAVVLGLLAWLGKRVFASLGHSIANAKNAANLAAKLATDADALRRQDVNAIHTKLDRHIDKANESHAMLLNHMGEQTKMLGTIHAQLERALGERPTRQEVRDLVRDRIHGASA